ncbi:MAG TPA: hypothetical protein VHH73_19960 [Verrucomicrobiae bacterium]|nr:hypothetical protein [Verrucomicrobiae bacterium]
MATAFVMVLGVSLHILAGPFVNLDFEQANIANVVYDSPTEGHGAAADLIPGWRLVVYDRLVDQLGYNRAGAAETEGYASLYDARSSWAQFLAPDGKYAVVLAGPYHRETYISQIGVVPADARYLELKGLLNGVVVSIDAAPLQLAGGTSPADNTARTLYYDLNGVAGQNVILTIQSGSTIPAAYNVLDSIAFTSVVPEPGPVALMMMGATMLGIRQLWTRPGHAKARKEG